MATGSRHARSGTPGDTNNHLVLLAENQTGYHNLIKLVSAGYTEGFYYKPRIDKELLSQHASGLIGLSSCLKGEVATGLRIEQPRKAREAAATFRDILGPGNFFLEMQYQGIEEQRTVNTGLQAIAPGPRFAPRVHQRRPLPQTRRPPAARRPLVHRTGKNVSDEQRSALPRRPVLPEVPRRDARRLRGLAPSPGEHGRGRGTLRRRALDDPEPPPELRRAGAVHTRRLLRACDTRRVRASGWSPCGRRPSAAS